MKKKKLVSLCVFISITFLPHIVFSKSHYKYAPSPKTDIYFGHISYAEIKHDGKDPVIIREGDELAKVAVLNFPLLPGDIIRTTDSRRCEIQFDTGTIIRLDLDTELKIETILAKSLSSQKKISNLLLNKGEIYIMYKRYSIPELFQVMTPNASVKMKHKTVAMINAREDGSTDIQVKRGKVYVVYGPDEKNTDEKKVNKSSRLTISKDHRPLQEEYEQDVDFEMWNEWINENFEELHKGVSPVPKPVKKFSPAVLYFAQKYSNMYGEWVWDDFYGYVWRPHYNDYYPWGSWQPYFFGQWREVNGQLFWVPAESWGWVPYHLGLWVWNEKRGWLWIPGSAFAPSWAMWDFHMGYYRWRPWSLWDWFPYTGYYGSYYGSYFYPYYDEFYPYYYYSRIPSDPDEDGKEILRAIRKDQLKKKQTIQYTLPKEMKKAYRNLITALKKGDKRVFESLRKIPEHSVVVKKEDLNAERIQEKALNPLEIPVLEQKESLSQKSIKDPYREAVRTYRRNEYAVSFGKKYPMTMSGKKDKGRALQNNSGRYGVVNMAVDARVRISRQIVGLGKERIASKPRQSGMRFRDWNPDVKVARRAGVSIKYSSRTNEVRCPELGLTSRNVRYMGNRVTRAGVFSSGGSSYSGLSVSSSSGSSRSGSSSSSQSTRGSSRGGSSSGGAAKKK